MFKEVRPIIMRIISIIQGIKDELKVDFNLNKMMKLNHFGHQEKLIKIILRVDLNKTGLVQIEYNNNNSSNLIKTNFKSSHLLSPANIIYLLHSFKTMNILRTKSCKKH
jgi:hypothetical protein